MTNPQKNNETTRSLKQYLPHIVTIGCTLLSVLASFRVTYLSGRIDLAKQQVESDLALERNQRENIYQIKKEAIFNALAMIDTYYSWQNFPEGIPVRKETTVEELTEKARDCYNHLCVTCTNATLLETFLKCVFGDQKTHKIPLGLYNQFRNEAREELGLEPLPLNKERIFLSVVLPEALSAASSLQAAKSQEEP